MNILILSSMTNKHFLEDFKLGNYFISHGHNVMVADINQISSTMDSVYDVVLYRNFASNDEKQYDATKKLFKEKIALIPNVRPIYSEYNVGLFIDVSLKTKVPLCEKAKTGIGYGMDFPYRVDNVSDTSNFAIQKKYEKYYHTIVIAGSIVYSYSEYKGLKKLEPSVPDVINRAIDSLNLDGYDMYEIIYVLDDSGEYRLSFVDATYVTLDIRLCDENKMFSKLLELIERKK